MAHQQQQNLYQSHQQQQQIHQQQQLSLHQQQQQLLLLQQQQQHAGYVNIFNDEAFYEQEATSNDIPQRINQQNLIKQKLPQSFITPLKQKEQAQAVMKDMKKYISFINSTDWMFQNDQNPIENYPRF